MSVEQDLSLLPEGAASSFSGAVDASEQALARMKSSEEIITGAIERAVGQGAPVAEAIVEALLQQSGIAPGDIQILRYTDPETGREEIRINVYRAKEPTEDQPGGEVDQ